MRAKFPESSNQLVPLSTPDIHCQGRYSHLDWDLAFQIRKEPSLRGHFSSKYRQWEVTPAEDSMVESPCFFINGRLIQKTICGGKLEPFATPAVLSWIFIVCLVNVANFSKGPVGALFPLNHFLAFSGGHC